MQLTVSHRSLLAAVVLLSSTILHSQVRIKEKVEINPKTLQAEKGKQGILSSNSALGTWTIAAWPDRPYVTSLDSVRIFYWPDGITTSDDWGPIKEAQLTVSVESKGDYVSLSYTDYEIQPWEDIYTLVPGAYYTGREFTVPLFLIYEDGRGGSAWFGTYVNLLYDESKGTFGGSTDTVYITVSGLDRSSTAPVVLVKEKSCAQVISEPAVLEPGEATTLEFKTEDGLPFGADTKFDVMIIGGGDNPGALQSSSGSGSFLSKTQAPVSYIAPTSIEGDSLVVQVAAYAYAFAEDGGSGGVGGIFASTRSGPNKQLQLLAKLSSTKSTGFLSVAVKPDGIKSKLTGTLAPKEKAMNLEQSESIPVPGVKQKVVGNVLQGAGVCTPTGLVVKKKDALDHFGVTIVPDSIAQSESCVIKAIAKDQQNETVSISGTTELNFLVSLNAQKYGKLLTPDGQGPTVNISYKDVQLGKLTYYADGEYLGGDLAVQVEISVVKGDDESKSGAGKLYIKPSIEPFCQNDGRWADTQYDQYVRKKRDGSGDSTDALGNRVYYKLKDKGCALTCMAMIAHAGGADTDPGRLAKQIIEPSHYGFNESHNILWRASDSLEGNSRYKYSNSKGEGLKYKSDRKTVDLDKSQNVALNNMDQFLKDGALIVAQVYNPSTKNQHFVLVTAKKGDAYQIIDPGCYGERTTLGSGYGDKVYKFSIYRKV